MPLTVNVRKLVEDPPDVAPDEMLLIARPGAGDDLEIHVANAAGTGVRKTPSMASIEQRISTAVSAVTSGDAAMSAHVSDTTPHPTYDDLPSLTIIFENGLV